MILIETHIVSKAPERIRFVDYLIGVFALTPTKNAVKKAMKRKELYHNGKLAASGTFIKENDKIEIFDVENRPPKHFEMDVEILFEDDFIAIVNKPAGLVVNGNQFQTLENAMVDILKVSKDSDAFKWSKPVHRLDAATSGLVILAKTLKSHRLVSLMFENKEIEKTYTAILVGTPIEDNGILNSPIKDQVAESHYKVIKSILSLRNDTLSLVELSPKTGRTHQLRIHCAEMGNAIVGDILYGKEGEILLHKGLFLHATKLNFVHPITSEPICIDTGIPYKFTSFLDREVRRWAKFKG
ncbi:MAG: 23S rRNA pseudouridine1911/1915/1917 synthase [Psychromonas sp.]